MRLAQDQFRIWEASRNSSSRLLDSQIFQPNGEHLFGQKLGVVLTGAVPRSRLDSGGWFGLVCLQEMRDQGTGWGVWGGRGGRDRQRNRQVNMHAFVKTTL